MVYLPHTIEPRSRYFRFLVAMTYMLLIALIPHQVVALQDDGPKLTSGAGQNGAQPAAGEDSTAAPATAPTVDSRWAEGLKSPRATMLSFTSAMEDGQFDKAVACLDLSELDHAVAEDKSKTYIFQLQDVIDRMAWINPATFALDADLNRPYALAKEAPYLSGEDLRDAQKIVIQKDTGGLWRFSPQTLAALDGGLWLRWHPRKLVVPQQPDGASGRKSVKEEIPFSLWLASQFPESWTRQHLLIPDYQWFCLLVLIFIGFLADRVTRFVLGRMTRVWLHLRQGGLSQEQSANPWKPVGLLAQAIVWFYGTRAIGLPASVLSILLVGLKLFAVVAAVWTTFLFINLLVNQLKARAAASATKFDDLLVPLVSRSLKALALCMGIITGAKAFDLPISGLVGGLGLGGAALALASKDAIANLFGSITVLTDRPFEVGDWIVTDKAEGTVETVGFRSTRIRTFYNSQITVPNSLLTTAIVDNMGRRRYRRIKTTLSIQYDTTPEQLDAFCEGIRELIRRHPYTRKDYYHVYFNQIGGSSLDILLYCFIECPEWAIELRERHRLLLDILRLAQTLGVQFAYPTRTLHLFNEEPQPEAPAIRDSAFIGRQAAAAVAGPPLTGENRPGNVEFHGPYEPDRS